MVAKKLSFAIFGNEKRFPKSEHIRNLFDYLRLRDANIYIESSFHKVLSGKLGKLIENAIVFENSNFIADYAISLGGDGTFLKAAAKVGEKGIPIIGVNMGRLGFLANIAPSELEQTLDDVYDNNYSLDERSVIKIESDDALIKEYPYALNDIAILKRDIASMITIDTKVDADYLITYMADGLIVSTPTGSTAYSLSNGGPIMVPKSGIICLTPVAPHSLNIRPIVVNDDVEIELRVQSRSQNFLVAIDGRSQKLKSGTTIRIKKAPFMINILKRADYKYVDTLRSKLMWGADKRE